MTIDNLIKHLSDMREIYGGETPVIILSPKPMNVGEILDIYDEGEQDSLSDLYGGKTIVGIETADYI